VTRAAKRCSTPATSGLPKSAISLGAHGAAAYLIGRPVAASSRKLVTIDTWTQICMLLKRRT